MKVLIAVEMHFYKTPDGTIWTTGVNDYKFWCRYLQVFDHVTVIARVLDADFNNPNWIKSNGEFVSFISLPNYFGPWGYMRNLKELKKQVTIAVNKIDCAVLRVPGAVGTLVWKEMKKQSKLYLLEVCGDPWESLAPGTIKSSVRAIARILATFYLKKQCQEALGTAYVTEKHLQKRFPPKMNSYTINLSDVILSLDSFSTNYSSVEIEQEDQTKSFNPYENRMQYIINNSIKNDCFRILNIGSMETLYKGQEIQIKAIKECRDKGYNVRLDFAGEGRCQTLFKNIVNEHGLNEYIGFLGMLPGREAVNEELDRTDLFILPSLVEGLPRSLIEAMSRGLPCIATSVGGIPELLELEDLIPPNNSIALANKIMMVIDDSARRERMSKRNIIKAGNYSSNILEKRRLEFYGFLKKQVTLVESYKR